MNKFFGYLLSPLFYLAFFLCLLVFQPIQWLAYKLSGYGAHKRSVDLLNFCLTYCNLLLGSSISFRNTHQLPTDRPMIFVANHQSMYDIPALIWFLRDYHVKFISKIELTKGIPSISFNLKYGGGANIDRKDRKQALSEIMKLGRRMKENNWSAMIFAEGTRARDGVMRPFQFGGIATLLKTTPNALIVPVAIQNSWKLVHYGSFPLSAGEKLSWTVLSPIEPEGQSPEAVVSEAEHRIREFLGQPLPPASV